ncbi:TonB-dependent receptor [Flavihumibacter petaseus]|uniref:Putative TonB-dependent receptor n=1 Tax=Flavihumibacter petaseus NBRC 106054 TaxID=1220578 RepID=A0A0E9MYW5_9BACT|nr:TonB-dependent receptor [Flavihumibacter petaseus]GAO42305.1 putative TonB-dependent receptor [Flavihumibacter petaseus NBRC 106054]
MKFCTTLVLAILLCASTMAQSQHIKGTITGNKKEPLARASIVVKGKMNGTITDEKGNFTLDASKLKLPLTLIVSSAGLADQEITVTDLSTPITVQLEQKSALNEVVVAASRSRENLLQSPVSIEKMNYQAVREVPSLSFYESLQSLKGMEMFSVGLGIKTVNTRGFNGTSNARFLQLIDGIDNQPPGLNFPMGNLFGVPDIDVESAELIPGAASALYGPSAFNGMLSIQTKDPFKYQGLSLYLKTGINHVNDPMAGAQAVNDIAMRYAKSLFKDRFAFKVNFGYFNGLDWYAHDYTDISAATPPANRGPKNPGYDGLNIYGDEVARVLPGIGLVARTGYQEKDLMNYNTYSAKGSVSLQYKFGNNLRLIYQYNRAQALAAFTSSARMNVNGFVLQTHRIELRHNNSFIRAYSSGEICDNGYNTRTLGQFINRYWVKDLDGNVVTPDKADQTWFTRYAAAYNGTVEGITAANHDAARSFADDGRMQPNTPAFNQTKDAVTKRYGTQGAGIYSHNKFYHADGQYEFTQVKAVNLLAGGSFRMYDMNTNGTLIDDKDQKITIKEYGAFVQAMKQLLNNKLKLTASVRYDKNENFKGSFTPRFSAVYEVMKNHYFRASVQTGFRNPTPIDQYIKLNAGPITILGGVPNNSKGMNVYENSFTAASVGQYAAGVQASVAGGMSQAEAIEANKSKLVQSHYPYITPEKQSAFEVGYKAMIGNRLYVDVNYYYSRYTNFILNAVVARPSHPVMADGEVNTDAAADLLNGGSQNFQLYTNASDKASGQGATLGLTYNLNRGFTVGGNVTWSSFILGDADPSKVAPFNTPKWSTNLNIGNTNLYRNFGFNANWHWQDAFDWYGPFNGMRPGPVTAYSLIDVQINKKLPQLKSMIKIGASNLLNNMITTAYGSPTIGGVYYVSLTIDDLFN